MRIAYLTTCSPVLPTSGHSLRTYANWQALRALGEVRLYALNTHPPASLRAGLRAQGIVPLPSRREPRPAAWTRQAVALATGKSVLYVKAMSPRRLRRLADEMRAWGADLLVVGETWLADLLPAFRGAVGRVVVDTHNVESRLYARVAAERSWPGKAKVLLYGRNARGLERGLAEADAVWAASPADAEIYRRELGLRHVAVVPNGLDTDAYAPGRWAVEPGTVVCTGTYAYWPNQAAGMHLIGLSRRLDRDGIPAQDAARRSRPRADDRGGPAGRRA